MLISVSGGAVLMLRFGPVFVSTVPGIVESGVASGAAAGVDSDGGVVVHAPSATAIRQTSKWRRLVTESDAQYIDLGRAQSATQQVEFIQVVSRADNNPVIFAVIHGNALDV